MKFVILLKKGKSFGFMLGLENWTAGKHFFFFFLIAILQYSNWNSENAHVSLKENPSLTSSIKRDIPIVYVYFLVSESRC